MVRVEIVAGPIAVERALGCPAASNGSIVEFQGVVREMEDGRAIRAIDYECHRPMAEAHLWRIARETAARFALDELTVIHRMGVVPAGETSLYVRVVSGHRGEGLAAVAALIDSLKRDVPIWKHPVA